MTLLSRNSYRVGARTFSVDFKSSDSILDQHPDVRSYIDHISSRIVVRDDGSLSDDARDELLIHEILHAIVKNSGLDQCLREGFTEEFLVSALTPRLHDFIVKNVLNPT